MTRTWLRVLLPALLIIAWLAGASFGGPLFGKVDEVSSNEQTAYLPESADATQVQERLGEFQDSDAIPAIAVFTSSDELTDDELSAIDDAVSQATSVDGVLDEVSPALPSDDGLAVQAFIPIDSAADVGDAVVALSDELSSSAPDGVDVMVTGPAGFSADLVAGFAGIDGLLLGVALIAVLIILVLVYRSALLPFIVLSTSLFALCVALLVVWWLAKWEVLLLSGQTQGILFILVIGAATDYALLFVSRFREELRHTSDKASALLSAWRGSLEPIAASGGTVIAGLLCLLLSDLKSNSTLGPVAAIGIVFAMLSALTLLPALLFVFGRAAFWPRVPHADAAPAVREATPAAAELGALAFLPVSRAVTAPIRTPEPHTDGIWGRVASLVSRRPRWVWLLTTAVLIGGAAFVPQLQADGVPQSDLVLGASEARDGQAALGKHFPGGSGSPVYAIVPEDALQDTADEMLANDGVTSVAVTAADAPSGSAPSAPACSPASALRAGTFPPARATSSTSPSRSARVSSPSSPTRAGSCCAPTATTGCAPRSRRRRPTTASSRSRRSGAGPDPRAPPAPARPRPREPPDQPVHRGGGAGPRGNGRTSLPPGPRSRITSIEVGPLPLRDGRPRRPVRLLAAPHLLSRRTP